MNTRNIILWIAVILFLTPFIAYSTGPYTEYYDVFTVSSGSMEPDIPKNSLIYTAPVRPENIQENDVITFKEDGGDLYTTHRVIEVVEDNGDVEGLGFRTKGDANEDPDPGLVGEDEVVGKVMLTIPFAGGLIYFARTSAGIFLLVLVPAGLLVLREVYEVVSELREV